MAVLDFFFQPSILFVLVPLCLYSVWKVIRIGHRESGLPPGPPTMPILGNAHMIPTTGLGLKFREWSQIYGPIFSLKVFNSNMIVISDRESVHNMLDQKGIVYGDRPRVDTAMYVTDNNHFSFEQQGKSWKEKRAIVSRYFSPQLLDSHHYRVQEAEAMVFLSNILRDPDNMPDYAKLYTVSVVTCLAWGQRAKDFQSFWFKDFFHVMDEFNQVLEPGSAPPSEIVPLLWYMPGKWKTRVERVKKLRKELWTNARKIIDDRRSKGDKRDCLIDQKLDEFELKGWPFEQWIINNLFGEIIEGGADTTANHLRTMILALATHPQAQEKARKELDTACGTERSPQLTLDFEKCPYVNCIIKEGMRWRPTAMTGLPHRATKDDVYNGYTIPKDSTVFMSIWALHQNDAFFPDANSFNPDRYLNHPKLAHEYANSSNYENRDHYGYGSGRRICPGMHLAERNMWRIAAKIIWAFEISEPEDPVTGKTQHLDVEAYTTCILVSPKPYKVKVKLRSDQHKATILRELVEAEEFLSQYH